MSEKTPLNPDQLPPIQLSKDEVRQMAGRAMMTQGEAPAPTEPALSVYGFSPESPMADVVALPKHARRSPETGKHRATEVYQLDDYRRRSHWTLPQ